MNKHDKATLKQHVCRSSPPSTPPHLIPLSFLLLQLRKLRRLRGSEFFISYPRCGINSPSEKYDLNAT